ncbi:MAG: aminotransferase class V-fold PLP-dependent enzyme, partial [Acidimicrobiales bacterium]
ARLVVDASQSLGVIPLDVTAVRPDFVVSVGYKWLLGPVGRSYLWVAEEHRQGRPLEENWIARAGAEDFSALVDYRDEYQPGARRFDQGQRTLLELTPMAIAALEQIHEWGVERIGAALGATTAAIVERIGRFGLAPSAPSAERSPHILGIAVPAEARARVLPALEQEGCHAALRGSSLRVAPYLHVDDADIDRLVTALASAI